MATARVWITGASLGIGRACAERFALDGAGLALCARRPEPLQAAAGQLKEAGASQIITTACDVTDRAALQRFASEALEGLGGCDVLIHNAGGGGPGGVLTPDDATFESDWRYAFDVNVMAAARLARHAAAALRDSKGVLILVSSAWRRRAGSAMPASYGAAKAALDDLTGSLAREFGPDGVRVVGIAPGPIWTETWESDLQSRADAQGQPLEALRAAAVKDVGDTTALRRPGTMREAANAIHWAASPAASYLTGTTLVIDGGFTAGT